MSQMPLLERAPVQDFVVVDGRLALYPQMLSRQAAQALFTQLHDGIRWQQETIRIAGRRVPIPRLQAWHGDPQAHYCYSGLALSPRPWTPALYEIKQQVEALTGASFNSVLLNCYRDGQDSMGWHSDDEPELGAEPVIASLSLGAVRTFVLRHRQHRMEKLRIELPPGSLLLMAGRLQQCWQHQLPKTRRPVGARINLTFRHVKPQK